MGDDQRTMIPESHSLTHLFGELIHHHFDRDIGLRDSEVQDYIVNMLSEFCEIEQMFKIRNANERPLNDVGEMLLEADPVYGPAPSFDRERQVRKHIGDYTLFLAGMFPESINHFRMRRQRLENFVDEELDHGAIIVQKTVPVLDADDEHTLAERILEQEHVAYTEAIKKVLDGKSKVVGRRLLQG